MELRMQRFAGDRDAQHVSTEVGGPGRHGSF